MSFIRPLHSGQASTSLSYTFRSPVWARPHDMAFASFGVPQWGKANHSAAPWL